jgi:hypothetical protein
MTPVEIDTIIAEKEALIGRLSVAVCAANEKIANLPEKISKIEADAVVRPWRRSELREAQERLKLAIAELPPLKRLIATTLAEIAPYNDEFLARGRWSRWFLVLASDGHIHRDTNCSSCFPTTQYSWLVNHSGRSTASMVSEFGDRLCTVCFPDAPVAHKADWRFVELVDKRLAREEREAKTQAKADKAAANAISHPDGLPLEKNSFEIKTVREAKLRIVDALEWVEIIAANPERWRVGALQENQALAQRLAEALAYKNDTSVELEMAAAQKRLKNRK